MFNPDELAPASWAVSGGRGDRRRPGDPLNVPIVLASNFVAGGEDGYARDDGTETWRALEDLVGGLEHGHAVSFASGMAATAALFDLLPTGARVVVPEGCYQGVVRLADRGQQLGRWSVQRTAVDDTAGWIDAAGAADLLWVESPSNPMLVVADLPAIAAAPRKAGAVLAVDNTFATPINQQPLLLGADVVVHSATKFLGGHSDLLAGVAVTSSESLRDGLIERRAIGGATPGALEAFLAVRGVRTLGVRMAASQSSADELARRLAGHGAVDVARYPGLASDPNHATAVRVLCGFGSVVSFDVAGGAAHADAVCERLQLIEHATSLGGVESTIERRAALQGQEHVPPGLLRLSVGCEDVEDLWRDLSHALDGVSL